ncbi:MAG: mannose-1-phosphate guanylyltransferase/mannose-6-phosphate isomerase [Anderseniella sp.]|nr:mannose-1-phosphate guanylyltransferase/mannose-6-phosphate isomerase [Anderseniella sp.]
MNSNKITPIILAGGAGTRLWPVSREETPKQFCRLLAGGSLFQATLARVSDESVFSAPIIVTGAQYASVAEQQLVESSVTPAAIICEPVGRDTAPAIAAALLASLSPANAQNYLVLPSDHAVEDETALVAAVTAGADLIRRSSAYLVTFGIKPSGPETGFGYIQAEARELSPGTYPVRRFVEKPDETQAAELLTEASTCWNAGIFLFNGQKMLAEMERYSPEILRAIENSLMDAEQSGKKLFPAMESFARAPKLSIDYAVMEHTNNAVVIPVDPGWSDLGSWGAMWEHGAQDISNNVLAGDVLAVNSTGSLIQSSGPMVAVAGVSDIVVVANKDAVLVAHRDDAQSVKSLVETMKADERCEQKRHAGEDRPWGRFDSLDRGQNHQVKRIRVDPGGQLSLQYHHHRAEHWIIIAGMAQVTIGKRVMTLGPCEQAFIPQGEVHRLENPGDEPVELIEVQHGDYFGEDDIVRLEDVYGREQIPAAAHTTDIAA